MIDIAVASLSIQWILSALVAVILYFQIAIIDTLLLRRVELRGVSGCVFVEGAELVSVSKGDVAVATELSLLRLFNNEASLVL